MKRFLTLFMLACLVFGAASTATADARPSYQNGFARSPSESALPEAWRNLLVAVVPAVGNTGGSLRDVGPRRHSPLVLSAASLWTIENSSPSLRFDIADEGGKVTASPFLKVTWPVTLMLQIKRVGTPSDNAGWMSVTYDDANGNPYLGYAFDYSSGPPAGIRLDWNSGGTFQFFRTGYIPALNTVETIIAVFTSTDQTLYADGIQVATQSVSASNPTYAATSQLTMGAHTGLGRTSNVVVYSGYIWDRALSAGEIQEYSRDPLGIVRLADTQGVRSIQDVAAASSSQIIVIAWLGVFGSLTMLGFIRRKKPNAR